MTQPEIRHTTPLKLKLIGSRTKLKFIGQVLKLARFQSRRTQISLAVKKKAAGIRRAV